MRCLEEQLILKIFQLLHTDTNHVRCLIIIYVQTTRPRFGDVRTLQHLIYNIFLEHICLNKKRANHLTNIGNSMVIFNLVSEQTISVKSIPKYKIFQITNTIFPVK